MKDTRKVTNQLLELVDDGILDPRVVILACLSYMSEDDVADMAHCNKLILEEEEDEDDE
jgi:hypothetical protein